MKAVVTPDRPETREALKALTTLDPRERAKVLMPKLAHAFAMWALARMGKDARRYSEAGLYEFYELAMRRIAADPTTDALSAMRSTSLMFPLALGEKADHIPVRVKSGGFLSYSDLLRDYNKILASVTEAKRKRSRSSAHFRLTIAEALPGISKARADEYRTMKPSAIVLDSLARDKYGLRVGGEALKKYLLLARNPDRLVRKIQSEQERQGRGVEKALRELSQVLGIPLDSDLPPS